jgi:hypothetical protein
MYIQSNMNPVSDRLKSRSGESEFLHINTVLTRSNLDKLESTTKNSI